MPTRDGYPEGTPSWTDLGTPDVDGAKAFYSALFGWQFQEAETDSAPYQMAIQRELAAAGIGSLQDENIPTVWTTYFAVEDADASAEKITSAGGTILMPPFDVMDAGRMAIAADPTGAVFGIWQATNHFGAQIVNEHGALNWNELMTDDLDTAFAFYKQALGHEVETTDMGGGFMYSTLNIDGRGVSGAMAKPDGQGEIPNHWSVYFAVDSAAEAVAAVEENGGKVIWGPNTTEGVGTFVGVADPYGAHFNMIELAGPVD